MLDVVPEDAAHHTAPTVQCTRSPDEQVRATSSNPPTTRPTTRYTGSVTPRPNLTLDPQQQLICNNLVLVGVLAPTVPRLLGASTQLEVQVSPRCGDLS